MSFHFKRISTSQLFLVNSLLPANMLQRLFYTSFNENVILTTAATFKTQKQKTSYSRKTR